MSYSLDMLSNILLLLLIIFSLPRIKTARIITKYIIGLLVIGISWFIPLYMGSNLLWIMRGVLGNLSISTTILSFLLLVNNLYGTKYSAINQPFAMIIVLFCTTLYLCVFGIFSFDLYDLGFMPNNYLLLIFFIILMLVWRIQHLNAWILLIGFIGYYCKIQNSVNLWDYLVDPVLWLYCVIFLYCSIFRRQKI